uniref:Uncharacterized protein n=1 Tax=Arundo donax TaxID=35708 RepID=A0A0A9ACC7_ARUDO
MSKQLLQFWYILFKHETTNRTNGHRRATDNNCLLRKRSWKKNNNSSGQVAGRACRSICPLCR